jgi:hypothetical protein
VISEEGRRAREEQWDKLGLERVKADLLDDGGYRIGALWLRELAWEWARKKEAEREAARSANGFLSRHGRSKAWDRGASSRPVGCGGSC